MKRWYFLHIVAKKNYEKIAELLLENGASVNSKNNNDQTVLITASYHGSEHVIKLTFQIIQE